MRSVLIIEDDYYQASNLAKLFTSLGHTLAGVVSSGEDGVSVATRERPDILIADVALSGRLDGIAAAARIIASHPCGLIFITAYDDAELVERMNGLRPAAIILKPATERKILQAVERIASRRRPTKAGSPPSPV